MFRILPFAVILITVFAFTPVVNKGHVKNIVISTDTVFPDPLKVYIVSPEETRFIKAEDLWSARELKITDSKEGYRIQRFRISSDCSGCNVTEVVNAGSKFNYKVITVLDRVRKGHFITIEDIELLSMTGVKAKASPLIINVD